MTTIYDRLVQIAKGYDIRVVETEEGDFYLYPYNPFISPRARLIQCEANLLAAGWTVYRVDWGKDVPGLMVLVPGYPNE